MANNTLTAPQPAAAIPFSQSTRLRSKILPTITRPTGGGLSSPATQLPQVGLLKGIHLAITGTLGGTITSPNALGQASILKRVSLSVNNGNKLFSVSGAGYFYLLRDFLDGYYNPFPASTARNAVATGAVNLDLYIPVMLNEHDPIGLVMLQNQATLVTLELEWESDANVGTGATFTNFQAVPTMEYFQVPDDIRSYPDLTVFHSIIEDQIVVSQTSGDFQYQWQRGNIYLQMLHGYGFAASGADNWTKAVLRANQSDVIYETTPSYQNFLWSDNHPTTRPAGVFGFDLLGSSGIGAFGSSRDQIDSTKAADIYSVITVTGAGTLYAIRRMLIPATY